MISVINAETAGTLAESINGANGMIAVLNQGIADNSYITGGQVNIMDGVSGQVTDQIFYPFSVAESATIFNTMISILNARITNWTNELNAL